jgi:DNA repair exonuclease SbcCD ATPase subunit
MIQLQSLMIEHFRGIQKLSLRLDGRNFAIYGPNGTGKSGVVDAIEFAVTGGIGRLAGEGSSDISLKSHAPHVDHNARPELAKVTLTAFIPSLEKTVTIERTVGASSAPKIVSELEQHPEFALTRREIIKYILAAPAERSKGVQALLRLDRIDKIRQSLQTIVNSCVSDGKRIATAVQLAQTNLARALGIPLLSKSAILAAANQRRQILQLDPLTDLGPDTSLKMGMGGSGGDAPSAKTKIPKKQAQTDVIALAQSLAEEEPQLLAESRGYVASILRQLLDSPVLLRSLKQKMFLRTGFDLIEGDICPFCDNPWEVAALQAHVRAKLESAKQATDIKKSLEKAAGPLAAALEKLQSLVATAAGYSRQLGLPTPGGTEAQQLQAIADATILTQWAAELRAIEAKMTGLEDLAAAIDNLSRDCRLARQAVKDSVARIQAGIAALPDVSKEDEAKEFLAVCQERLETYRETRRQQERCKQQIALATKALDAYSKSSTAVLTKIYTDVEADFSKYLWLRQSRR